MLFELIIKYTPNPIRLIRFFSVAVIVVLVCACSEHDTLPTSTNEKNYPESSYAENEYSISEDDAVEIFSEYLNSITSAGEISTRAGLSGPNIKSVNRTSSSRYVDISGAATRSGEEYDEVTFYELTLQNSDDTEGFAVVVGDQRFPEVVTYCPYGSIADTVHIEGTGHVFS